MGSSILCCLADSSLYDANMFGPDEYFLSPDVENPDNIKTFRIRAGTTYIDDILQQYPQLPRHPTHVVIKTDALGRNFVRGLSRMGCPSLVSVADTHHLHRPIERVQEYLLSENFSIISFENDRHHMKWFKETGQSDLCWLPNLFLATEKLEPLPLEYKDDVVCFIGSLGQFHPFRVYIINYIKERIANLKFGSAPKKISHHIYNKSLINLNISLNGDLNWRFFEIIASGGFLITDRLCPDSGIHLLFDEGVHYEAFGSKEELLEKILFYKSNPRKACDIAQQAYEHYWENYSPLRLRKEAMKRLFWGFGTSIFDLDNKEEKQVLKDTLRAYQAVQEIYRNSQKMFIYYDSGTSDSGFLQLLSDYPRIGIYPIASSVLPSLPLDDCIHVLLVNCIEKIVHYKSYIEVIKPSYIIGLHSNYVNSTPLNECDYGDYSYDESLDCLSLS